MNYDRDYGLCAPDMKWVPSPQYLLRRDRILRHMRGHTPGKLLEIGCGSGALLADFARLGYECHALEISPEARELAQGMTANESAVVEIAAEPAAGWANAFDVLVACEVLEHIEKDEDMLRQWVSYLRPGGTLILSVPAHPSKWDATDEWAGHYRRYTRSGLKELFIASDLSEPTVECYAFPFTNIIAPIRSRVLRRQQKQAREKHEASDQQSRTHQSGISRHAHCRFFPLQSSLPGRWIIKTLMLTQSRFVATDLGLCYLAIAPKA